jgi:hypothetical protein
MLLQNEIELEQKSIALNNDALLQMKEKEKLNVGNADVLSKITEKEKTLDKQIQDSQKKIQDLANSIVTSITALNDAKNKIDETNIKLVGSVSTKNELLNDQRKAQILQDTTDELNNNQNNYDKLQKEYDANIGQVNNFSSDKLSVEDNKALKDLLNKQLKDSYLNDEDQQKLTSVEAGLAKVDPDKSTKLLSVVDLLTSIRDKKTDTEITIQNQTDAKNESEYNSAYQVIQNNKSLDEAEFTQNKKDWAKSLYNVSESDFDQYKTNKIAQDNKDIADTQNGTDPNSLYSQDEILAKQNDIANTQKQNYSDIYDWESTFTEVHQQRIDQLEKENELETQKEASLKNENDLLKLQKELNDALNSKTDVTYIKDKDGNWQKKYIADSTKVDDLQSQIADKMQSNADALKQQEIANEKQYESDLINTQKAAYDKLVNDQQNILTNKYSDMNYLATQYLQQIKDQAGNNDAVVQAILAKGVSDSQTKLDAFIADVNGKVTQMATLLQSLADDAKKVPTSTGATVPTVVSSTDYQTIQQDAVNIKLGLGSNNKDGNTTMAQVTQAANNCIEIEKAFSSMEGTARQYINKK